MVGKLCWVVTDGRPGMENEALGVAEAVGLGEVVVKRVRPRPPWRWLPAQVCPWPLVSLGPDSDPLEPPWPDLAIGCGRHSVPLILAIGRRSAGRTFTVQLQHPHVAPERFGLVAPPAHDQLQGPNVVATRGALHRVSAEKLAQAAQAFAPRLGSLPHPRVAVLVGGDNSAYRLGVEQSSAIAADLRRLAEVEGGSILLTPSRRTGAANLAALNRGLEGVPGEVWQSEGENPYFAYLALADYLVVTNDSVAMVSEACATGKPVFVIELAARRYNRSRRKFETFHAELRRAGLTRPWAGRLERWTYEPLNDTAVIAAEIRRRLGLSLPAASPQARPAETAPRG